MKYFHKNMNNNIYDIKCNYIYMYVVKMDVCDFFCQINIGLQQDKVDISIIPLHLDTCIEPRVKGYKKASDKPTNQNYTAGTTSYIPIGIPFMVVWKKIIDMFYRKYIILVVKFFFCFSLFIFKVIKCRSEKN